jgi:hypothetical protein
MSPFLGDAAMTYSLSILGLICIICGTAIATIVLMMPITFLIIKYTQDVSSPSASAREIDREVENHRLRLEALEQENRRLREEIAGFTKGPASEGFTP